MKGQFLIVVVQLLMVTISHAQNKQNFNWQLSLSGTVPGPVAAALNFEDCEPTVLNNSVGSAFEGQSSISDSETGALLFYTDGYSIYNANYAVMQNGNVAGLSNTAAQNIIIKRPGSSSLYYVFTPDIQAGSITNTNFPDANGVNYAEVDLSLNGGLGAVTSSFNPIKPPGNCEMLTGVFHANGEDVWLIGHEYGNNNFYAFLITSDGINPDPIVTSAGPTVFTFPPGIPFNSKFDAIGELKASPDRTKLAFTTFYNGYTCLVDFDNATGTVSNPIELSLDGLGGYGTSFSPDNSKLYFTVLPSDLFPGVVNNSIYQFDISSNDAATIQDTRTTIFTYEAGFRSLKLGPNGKMYVARTTTVLAGNGSSYIGVINEPNNAGLACNYEHDALFLNGPFGTWGLNNVMEDTYNCNDFVLNLGPDVAVCPGASVTLNAAEGQQSYLWSTGQTSSSITVSEPGTYWVTITNPSATLSDTIVVSNFIPAGVAISGSFTACPDGTTLLTATEALSNYLWSNGATTLSVNAGAGLWWVTATDANGCQNSDTVTVVQAPTPFVEITGPEALCASSTATLFATPGLASYTWSQGSTEASITAPPGSYSVTASDSLGCTATAQISIAPIIPIASIEANPNPVYGTGLPVQFQSTSTAAADTLPLLFWQWDFGGGDSSNLENTTHIFSGEGTFPVQLTITDALGCTGTATVEVEVIGNLILPNVITPNGDGQNDVFFVQNLDLYPPAALSIYNRWGVEIFQSPAYANNWAPDPAADAVYFYILRLHDGRTFAGPLTSLGAGR